MLTVRPELFRSYLRLVYAVSRILAGSTGATGRFEALGGSCPPPYPRWQILIHWHNMLCLPVIAANPAPYVLLR
jgi:hypothetical protein